MQTCLEVGVVGALQERTCDSQTDSLYFLLQALMKSPAVIQQLQALQKEFRETTRQQDSKKEQSRPPSGVAAKIKQERITPVGTTQSPASGTPSTTEGASSSGSANEAAPMTQGSMTGIWSRESSAFSTFGTSSKH